MCIAATGSTELAEEVTRATGAELKLAGLNWNYNPVADVNSNPKNPVIGPRSFGDGRRPSSLLRSCSHAPPDPARVGEFSCAVNSGLTTTGIVPCAKHFPGHGDTQVDSHLGLPRIPKSLDELRQAELVPFRSLIAAGVPTVMTGHMAMPNVTGSDIPCSLSRDITTDLLREELGFKGVVVTDCLEMNAVAQSHGVEKGALMALNAGADIAMACHTPARQKGAVELVREAVANGQLVLDSLRESQRRIARLKSKFAGSWSDVLNPVFDSGRMARLKSKNAALSASAYSASTTLVTDPTGILPISGGDMTVLFTPGETPRNLAAGDPPNADTSFASFIAARNPNMHHTFYTPGFTVTEELNRKLSATKYIVFATRDANRSPWQLKVLLTIAKVKNPHSQVIIISTSTPYDLLNAKPNFPFAYLATFEPTIPAFEAVTKVIFGEAKPTGKVPVLDGNIF